MAARPYIVSELLEGESLGSRLKAGALPVRKAIDYARQTADGLAAAHDKNLVHRDLKPDNLFLTNDGRLKILDFGIAKLTTPGDDSSRPTGFPTETADGIVVGTAGYMSPEQVRGETVDVRSDIFSFGGVFYEMLTGRPAFIRETGAETLAAILKEDPPESISATVPPALVRIVARCLEKKREARFQSARDLSFALEFLSGTASTAAAASAASFRPTALAHGAGHRRRRAGRGRPPRRCGWPRSRRRPGEIRWRARGSPAHDWEGAEEGAEISPDGRFVAFLSDRDGEFDIWLKQIGSADWTNLTREHRTARAERLRRAEARIHGRRIGALVQSGRRQAADADSHRRRQGETVPAAGHQHARIFSGRISLHTSTRRRAPIRSISPIHRAQTPA